MASQFIGCHVSINCGPVHGFFQGSISAVDSAKQTITIQNPYKNGVKCSSEDITLESSSIVDLTMIDDLMSTSCAVDNSTSSRPTTSHKPALSKQPETVQRDRQPKPCKSGQANFQQTMSPPRVTHSFREQRHPFTKDNKHHHQGRQRMDSHSTEDCFNIDYTELTEDFDFEKNLALFDKHALTPNKTRKQKTVAKYRHDENVIESKPVVYRQIVISKSKSVDVAEYYTDAGLVVPCITMKTQNKICQAAEQMGISGTRQIEAFAISACQMALSVLGGSNRLHPRNAHQAPNVVIFTGPHKLGAQGVATARLLANQNAHVEVFMADVVKMYDYVQEELKLLVLTSARLISDVKDLPTTPVDLVIYAMDDDSSGFFHQHSWYKSIQTWCSKNMAPVMCLCPPDDKEPLSKLNIKWTVCSVLPQSLPESYGSVYLLDTGLPPKAFKQLAIKYSSPFCSKPFIALHRNR